MKPFWAGRPELDRDLEEVRATILRRAATEDPDVQGAVQHLFAAPGKMLRPAFVIIASRFGTPEHERIVRVAAAIEMLHMATLVHDDIIDGAATRRGVATLQALKGARTAVLIGDWLLAACVSLVAETGTIDDARALSRLVARICGSEIGQSTDRYVLHTSLRRYLRRIAGKTAALFALSFHVGAVESGCTPELCSVLRRLGYYLGMGFQIIDDILDFAAPRGETGKPTRSDLSQGILTLPAIIGLQADDGRLRRVLDRRPRSWRAVARASRLIAERGGMQGARDLAAVFTDRSRREIGRLPCNDARTMLLETAESLLTRSY